jgi:hypothetical protein
MKIILALAVLLTVVQTSPPVPGQTPNSTNGARQDVQQQSPVNKKQSSGPSPIVQQVTPAPQQDAGEAIKKQNAQEPVTVAKLPPMSVEKDWMDRLAWVFNGVLVGAGCLGVWAAFRTLKAIDRQANLMQRQLELSERPWVSAERIPLALRFDGGGAQLICNFKLENTGGSVAWYVSVWTELVPTGNDWRPVLQRLCNIPKDPVNAASDYGYVLFPGKDLTVRDHPAVLGQQAMQQAIQTGPFKDLRKIGLTIVGCVDYRSHVSEEHHQTTFVDLVGYVEQQPIGPVMGAFDPSRQTYMPIILSPTEHGASAS